MLKPVKKFFNLERSSAILLFSFAGLAIYMANSSWHNLYSYFNHFPIAFDIGKFAIKTNSHEIINEVLMAFFFLVVGMEVKKELVDGELSSPSQAALPLIAAIGGFITPAIIYSLFNQDPSTILGWGIPTATDIAFALGAFQLISRKVPVSLKIFLLCLAIVDDIFAVLVIALFYSQTISGPFLAVTAAVCLAIFIYFKLQLKSTIAFSLLAVALWLAVYNSGLHATLSGVVLGFLIPHKNLFTAKEAINAVNKTLSSAKKVTVQQTQKLSSMVGYTQSPLSYLIALLNPYVSLAIIPLFAFSNAGIRISSVNLDNWMSSSVSYGIIIGLCLGKPLGITLFAFLACATKITKLPDNVRWKHIISIGFLGGIGFTMSLFLTNLSFDMSGDFHSFAKLSVLVASSASGIIGILLLSFDKTIKNTSKKRKRS